MEQYSDQQLIAEYRRHHDDHVFEVLVQRYIHRVYRFVFKYVHTAAEAEDVVQDVFVKVWKQLDTYSDAFTFSTWLFTIAKHTAIDHLRKKKFAPVLTEDALGEPYSDRLIDNKPIPDELMSRIDDINELQHAVMRLPANYRDSIRLYYEEGLNFRQIAEYLKISLNTIKTRHRRALIQLKELMGKWG